jgi:undecaprenyl-diphosphatase
LVNGASAKSGFFLTFLVGLHVGTALGLIVYYRTTWGRLLLGTRDQFKQGGLRSLVQLRDPQLNPSYRTLAMLVIATIPVAVVGLAAEKALRVLFTKPLPAAIFLTANGVILAVGELAARRQRGAHRRGGSIASITPTSAAIIGTSQIAALIAGISRSGISMVTSLTRGLDHEESANFTFLLATPVILLAGIYKLPSLLGHAGHGVLAQSLVGACVAGVAAFISVKFLTKWFTTKTLWPFAIYCFVAGLLCVLRFA